MPETVPRLDDVRKAGADPGSFVAAENRNSSCPASLQVRSRLLLVGDTGIEPVTSSVSGKRATAAPIAPVRAFQLRGVEVATGFEPV